MSSSDEVPHEVDPDYAALFRQSSSDESPPAADPIDDPIDEAVPGKVPAPRDPMTDTGRLFRSQGVKGNDTAVLALSSVQGVRLRTLKRTDVEPAPIEPLIPDPAEEPAHQPAPAEPESRSTTRDSGRRKRRAASSLGLPARTCYLLIIGVTLLVAFVNAFLTSNNGIGWPTGIAMLAATVYCALKVRREDDVVPVITPPLAFFLTAITAAQLFLGSAERSLLNRAVVVFFTLANNWIWIIGATVVALVIMIVRRRRG